MLRVYDARFAGWSFGSRDKTPTKQTGLRATIRMLFMPRRGYRGKQSRG
jgi:hypothetical protein